jgi:RecA-family ATPase
VQPDAAAPRIHPLPMRPPTDIVEVPAGTAGTAAAADDVPDRAALTPTDDEIAAASLTPRCIVEHYLYADVAQLVAPGGTGKTTLLLYEAACIALGWPLWGLRTTAPGWTLCVTAEDQRERLIARLREIAAAMELSPDQRRQVFASVLFWDVTGTGRKLVAMADGNIVLTPLADGIVERHRADPPAIVTFDPLVSFGASEQAVNDNEQALVTAARRIVRGLGCCVRYVHHTGKANARGGTLDQYSGRGGSALPDGTRMTAVLQRWEPSDATHDRPPAGCKADSASSITILARAKLSYAPPNLPRLWIKRTGFGFEHFTDLPQSPEAAAAGRADQLERFLISQIKQGRRWTKRQLEDADLSMSRRDLRAAITALEVAGRVVLAELPAEQRQGSRTHYLCPADHCAGSADTPGAVPQEPTR